MEFLLGLIRDPKTCDLSSTRLTGVALVVSGIVFAFMHPTEAATVAALLGGGAFNFLTRTKAGE